MVRRLYYLSFVLLLNALRNYAQPLEKYEAQIIANKTLITTGYPVKIRQMFPVINDLTLIVVSPPYREYPSILIVKKDSSSNTWVRTFECLDPGIQYNSSELLDWHRRDSGLDFRVGNQQTYNLADQKTRKIVESYIKTKGVVIPYQNFIHMNTSSTRIDDFYMPYTIDKTHYFDFAAKLFPNQYKNFEIERCEVFNTPKIIDCQFGFIDNRYVVKIKTDNHQYWTYTFRGIDSANRYLIDKEIQVTMF